MSDINSFEKATSLVKHYCELLTEEELLIKKIDDEGNKLLPQIKELIPNMTTEEFSEFYHNIGESDLKFQIFMFIRKQSQS